MRRALRGVLLAGALAVPAGAADVTRACRHGDLVGTWVLAQLRVPPGTVVDRSNPEFFDYQVYKFDVLGAFRYVSARAPFTRGPRETVSAVPATHRWTVDERGWVTVTGSDGSVDWTAECQAVTDLILKAHDRRAPLPGDVLLTFEAPVRHRRHLTPPADR